MAPKKPNGPCTCLAIYSPSLNLEETYKIKAQASIFSAEALAILLTTRIIFSLNIQNANIFTDSLSVIEALSPQPPSRSASYIIYEIKKYLWLAQAKNLNIKIQWIPAHRGIPGNEKADQLAKIAPQIGNTIATTLPYTDFFPDINDEAFRKQSRLLQHSGQYKGQEYFQTYHNPSRKPWFTSLSKSRSLFSDLRSLAGTTLMNLLAALFMVQLLFIIGVGGVQDPELCISLGLSLQYIRVCVICWLAAMCHHLYATVATLPRRDDPPAYLKYSIFGWAAPLVSLGSATLLHNRETGDFWNVDDLRPFNCWFLGRKATVYTYGLPVILLLLISGYYLVKAAIVARYTCSMQLEVKQREKMKKRRVLQLVLFLKVSLIIGTVAGCGVVARFWEVPFLWAMFCTGHSLQGLAVALSVACNCRVLKMYAKRTYKQPKQQIAKSSSMQLLAPAPDLV